METYRLVRETDWRAALDAIENAANLLRQSGSLQLPGDQAPGKNRNAARKGGKDGLEMAREIVHRVDGGGAKHKPKPFDKKGPKISDFAYLLMDGKFAPPEAVDPVGKYVQLNEDRREATSQVRNAVRLDTARFTKHSDGTYSKRS